MSNGPNYNTLMHFSGYLIALFLIFKGKNKNRKSDERIICLDYFYVNKLFDKFKSLRHLFFKLFFFTLKFAVHIKLIICLSVTVLKWFLKNLFNLHTSCIFTVIEDVNVKSMSNWIERFQSLHTMWQWQMNSFTLASPSSMHNWTIWRQLLIGHLKILTNDILKPIVQKALSVKLPEEIFILSHQTMHKEQIVKCTLFMFK